MNTSLHRGLLPAALLLLVGCPASNTDTWPDPVDTDDDTSDVGTDTDIDTDTDSSGTGFTAHCGPIDADEVWPASGNPHFINCDVDILEGTVTLEPGVLVKVVDGAGIFVSDTGRRASFRAEGTAAEPIVIEPEREDDPNARWVGIVLNPDAADILLAHTTLRQTGTNFSRGALVVDDNAVTVDHLTIEDSEKLGINFISDGRLTDDSTGLVISGSQRFPVSISAAHAHTLPAEDSSYTGNAELGPEVRGGTITTDATWLALGVPYILTGSLEVEGYTDHPAVLTLSPGTEALFDVGLGLLLSPTGGESGLVSAGTAAEPVVLNARGASTGGYWRGIYARRGTTTLDLTHTEVHNAGRGTTTLAAVQATGTDLFVDNVTITGSLQRGVALTEGAAFTDDSTDLTVTGCTFPALVPSVHADSIPSGSFTGNTVDAFQLDGSIDRPTHWPRLDVPYWVDSVIRADGHSDRPAVLTIDAGTEVWFANDTRLEFSGLGGAAGLIARGTSADPIRFTAAEFAEPGAWGGIWFRNMCEEADVQLEHFVVEYAGGLTQGPFNLLFDRCNPTVLRNGVIRHSADTGLGLLLSTPLDVANLSFSGNFQDVDCGASECPSLNTDAIP